MDFPKLFFICFSLLISFSSASFNVVDFCVADFNYPVGPAGYPCRDSANLTVDDFVYSDFDIKTDTLDIFNNDFGHNASVVLANDVAFPALNGLGLTLARLDLGVNGVIAVHSHRVSEVILVIEGTIIAGFIGSDNTAYVRTLKKWDVMIFPHTLLHFQVNIGDGPVLALVSFNNANPGFQFTPNSLGGNDIPTQVIQKIASLDASQVRKLKKMFGGSN